MQRRPALIIGAVVAVIQSVIVALVVLDVVGWSSTQQAAILSVFVAIGALVQAVYTHRRTYSPDAMRQLIESGSGTTPGRGS